MGHAATTQVSRSAVVRFTCRPARADDTVARLRLARRATSLRVSPRMRMAWASSASNTRRLIMPSWRVAIQLAGSCVPTRTTRRAHCKGVITPQNLVGRRLLGHNHRPIRLAGAVAGYSWRILRTPPVFVRRSWRVRRTPAMFVRCSWLMFGPSVEEGCSSFQADPSSAEWAGPLTWPVCALSLEVSSQPPQVGAHSEFAGRPPTAAPLALARKQPSRSAPIRPPRKMQVCVGVAARSAAPRCGDTSARVPRGRYHQRVGI